jgi:hypothetical protein
LCGEHEVPVAAIGTVADTGELRLPAYGGLATWTLAELRAVSEATLPALFG